MAYLSTERGITEKDCLAFAQLLENSSCAVPQIAPHFDTQTDTQSRQPPKHQGLKMTCFELKIDKIVYTEDVGGSSPSSPTKVHRRLRMGEWDQELF